MVWLGSGNKTTWFGFRKDHAGFKTSVLVTTNAAGNCPQVQFNISVLFTTKTLVFRQWPQQTENMAANKTCLCKAFLCNKLWITVTSFFYIHQKRGRSFSSFSVPASFLMKDIEKHYSAELNQFNPLRINVKHNYPVCENKTKCLFQVAIHQFSAKIKEGRFTLCKNLLKTWELEIAFKMVFSWNSIFILFHVEQPSSGVENWNFNSGKSRSLPSYSSILPLLVCCETVNWQSRMQSINNTA